MTKECPPTVKVKAIDVKPYRYALWAAFEGGEPFANSIGPRRWSEDGEHIWFMLDSHNFFKARPDEELELIPDDHRAADAHASNDKRDDEMMAKRPRLCTKCAALSESKE